MPLPNAPQTQPMPGGTPPPGLPRSPAAGPSGPGASPMMSAGSGAGNQAAALAKLEKLSPDLINAMLAFPVGSKEFQKIQRAVESISSLVGKSKVSPGNVPPGVAGAAMSKMGPPPGIAPTNVPPPGMTPPMPGMSGEEAAA